MCHQCNYPDMLTAAYLEPTTNRLHVLEVIGNNSFPLSASDIYKTLGRTCSINRVTVYRILDRLVDHGIIERLSTAGRATYFGLAPNDYHQPHSHFYCKSCGQMDCLNPNSFQVDTTPFQNTFPGRIDKVEIRVDGICKNCMK